MTTYDHFVGSQDAPWSPLASVTAAVRAAKWPLVGACILVLTGMAYSFCWGPLVQHSTHWVVPGDIWGTFRSAHYVGWGDISDVYSKETGLVTLPLIAVVLAPVAMLTGALGLSEDLPYAIAHPTAWLVLGPVELIIGALVLFPLDAIARELGVSARRRVLLTVIELVAVWPVVAIWGHPEDVLAMTFALYGLSAANQGRWKKSGWLWGAALATQPLVILVLPIVFAMAPFRRWVGLVVRSGLPGASLLAIPLTQAWSQTTRALLDQPNYPSVDHATPWVALAPVLSLAHRTTTARVVEVSHGARVIFTTQKASSMTGAVVAAGPGRIVALLACIVIGVWVYRRRPSFPEIVWLSAMALGLRCVFESVMNPYYLWPPLALALVAGANRWGWRFAMAVATAGAAVVYSYHRATPWGWYGPILLLLVAAILFSRPAAVRTSRRWSISGKPDPVHGTGPRWGRHSEVVKALSGAGVWGLHRREPSLR